MASFMRNHLAIPNVKGAYPSRPHEYPHLVSGQLKASIGHRITSLANDWQLDVGTIRLAVGATDYYRFLEQGTREMVRRPFASRTLAEFLGGEFDVEASQEEYEAFIEKLNTPPRFF